LFNENREESSVNNDLYPLAPISLSLEDAKRLVQLPLDCIDESAPEYFYLIKLANSHVGKSLASLYDENYEGGHWL